MFRGTTPTITWKINDNLDFSTIEQVWMTFTCVDDSKITMTKDLTENILDSDKKTISYEFSQEETLQFKVGVVETQLRILLTNGKSYATEIRTFKVDKILKGGVIE